MDDLDLQLADQIRCVLTLYHQAHKDPNSWIHFYVQRLKIKPVKFSFKESRQDFLRKLIFCLDLIELAHIYCKLANPKDYSESSYNNFKASYVYIVNHFKELKDETFPELRNNLSLVVLFGAN